MGDMGYPPQKKHLTPAVHLGRVASGAATVALVTALPRRPCGCAACVADSEVTWSFNCATTCKMGILYKYNVRPPR